MHFPMLFVIRTSLDLADRRIFGTFFNAFFPRSTHWHTSMYFAAGIKRFRLFCRREAYEMDEMSSSWQKEVEHRGTFSSEFMKKQTNFYVGKDCSNICKPVFCRYPYIFCVCGYVSGTLSSWKRNHIISACLPETKCIAAARKTMSIVSIVWHWLWQLRVLIFWQNQ